MKAFVLMLSALLCLNFHAFAQEHDTTWVNDDSVTVTEHDTTQVSAEEAITNLFSNVTLSGAGTGYLWEHTIDLIDPASHTGTQPADSPSSYSTVMQFYGTLYGAAYNRASIPIASPQSFNTSISNFIQAGKIPIAILDMKFNTIDPTALQDGLLAYSNGQLSDGTNHSRSPFLTSSAFTASPCVLQADSPDLTFIIPADLFVSNQGKTVSSLQANFDDGNGLQTVLFDHDISIHYTGSGIHIIHITVNYTDNTSRTTYTRLRVLNKWDDDPNTSNTILHWGFGPVSGRHKGAKVTIGLACGHTKLIKPLIVAKGFDPRGDFTYSGFLDNWTIEDLSTKLDIENIADYDLVFVDYLYNMDAIENNANLLEDVIKKVNLEKAANGSTEKNVVMGISMGGLVARVCLKQMEAASENHDVKTFISFDAPHLGAYVPLSAQYFIDHLATIYIPFAGQLMALEPDIAYAFLLMESPAAQEMMSYRGQLITNVNNPDANLAMTYPTYPVFQNAFLKSLFLAGMPTQCRNVAISNGSQTAQDQGLSGHDLFFSSSAPAIPGLEAGVLLIQGDAQFELHALPTASQGPQLIYHGRINYMIGSHVALLPPLRGELSEMNVLVGSPYCMENVPGGAFGLKSFGFDINDISSSVQDLGGTASVGISQFSFVPTVSALNIKTNDLYNMYFNENSNNIVSSGKTDFMDIAGPTAVRPTNEILNETHTQFSSNNSGLFENELVGSQHLLDDPGFLTTISNTVFNFGDDKNGHQTTDIIGACDITNSSTVFINSRSTEVGVHGSGLPIPAANSNYNVYTPTSCPGPVTVAVDNTSNIIIGDPGAGNTGTLEITSGSTLDLSGTLEINDNCKVIIDRGATLIYRDGADIQLLGSNAILEIRGILKVDDNSTFTLNSSSTGFVRFYQTIQDIGVQNAVSGTNSKINFTGTGTGASNKILEVAGGEAFYPDDNFAEVKFENARIELTANSHLNIGCPLTINNVKITSTADGSGNYVYNAHRGLSLYGQSQTVGGVTSSSVSINGLEIDNGLYGISSLSYYGGMGLNLYNTKVFNCQTGIYTEGEYLNLGYSGTGNSSLIRDFSTVGWHGYNMSGASTLDRVEVYQSSAPSGNGIDGIYFQAGTTGTSLYATQSQAKYCNSGIWAVDANLTVANCKLIDDLDGVFAENCNLNMDTYNSPAGGHNDLSNNTDAGIYMDDQESTDRSTLDINEGYNNFGGNNVEIKGFIGQDAGGFNCSALFLYSASSNTWNSSSGPANTPGDLYISCSSGPLTRYTLNDNDVQNTFTSTYTGPNFNPVSIGNAPMPKDEFAGLITDDQPELKQLLSDAMKYLAEADYTDAIKGFDNALRTYVINKQDNDALEYQIYRKVIYAAEQARYNQDVNAKALIEETIQLQNVIMPGNKGNKEHYALLYNVGNDKAGLYSMTNRRDEALQVLDDMRGWVSSPDYIKLEFKHCCIAAEDSVMKGITRREDFARLIAPCTPPKRMENMQMPFKMVNSEITVAPGSMLLYPNPAVNALNIAYNAGENGNMSFKVMTMDGKVINTITNFAIQQGNNNYTLSTSGWSPGVYFISANADGKDYRQKFVITK